MDERIKIILEAITDEIVSANERRARPTSSVDIRDACYADLRARKIDRKLYKDFISELSNDRAD